VSGKTSHRDRKRSRQLPLRLPSAVADETAQVGRRKRQKGKSGEGKREKIA
jgi:hypothetical protein